MPRGFEFRAAGHLIRYSIRVSGSFRYIGIMILTVNTPDSSRAERLEGYLNRIADTDMASLKLLYEETSAGVYSFALSMMKNREDAEDILQEAFLTIHKSAHLYKPMGRPMEWIMTVTRNLCISRLRTRSKSTDLQSADEPADYSSIATSEDRIVLAEGLKALSDEEQRIVILHAVSGLKHREIAAVLGVPVSTVTSKYRRALKKLKTILEKGGAFREE